MMCLYDEAFTTNEMLEETNRCKSCTLNCVNAGKKHRLDKYIDGELNLYDALDDFESYCGYMQWRCTSVSTLDFIKWLMENEN